MSLRRTCGTRREAALSQSASWRLGSLERRGCDLAGTPIVATVDARTHGLGCLPSAKRRAIFAGRKTETEDLLRLTLRELRRALRTLRPRASPRCYRPACSQATAENVFPIYLRLDFSSAKPDLVAQVRKRIAREASAWGLKHHSRKRVRDVVEYFIARQQLLNARNRPRAAAAGARSV